MEKIRVEVLYPEICNLYGELGNIRYLKRSLGEACEVVETGINERPKFLNGGIDLVYMGTMMERTQLIVLDKLAVFKTDIQKSIESGQHFLVTGNAVDVFGKEIIDEDDMPYGAESERVSVENSSTECLGIFDYTARRLMLHRFNSLYVGRYEDLDIVGFKSLFAQGYYGSEPEPLFMTEKGPGFHKEIKEEGFHHRNFMATYLIGPIFVLNPRFMIRILEEIGMTDVHPALEEDAMAAYEKRLAEYREPNRGFYY